jgi:pilus assembly protein Flp/PilA
MNAMFLKMGRKFQTLLNRQEGQDLVEYALVLAMIALGIVTTMQSVATSLSTAFSDIAAAVTTNG